VATEDTRYLTYAEAVLIHILLMRKAGETRFGAFERNLVESALARPRHAAAYEGADLLRQAAVLCHSLIKNHPWVGGNKRTATAIVRSFLRRNRMKLSSPVDELIELVLAVESDRWDIDEIETWIRQHVVPM
jgi:death-on-curing protein